MYTSKLYSTEFEQAVLAALMTIDQCYEQLPVKPSVDDFFANRHKVIFAAIEHLASQGKKYDSVLVHSHLELTSQLDNAGGERHLMQIMAESSTSLFNVNAYVAKIKKFSERRKVEAAGHEIIKIAQISQGDDLASEAQQKLIGIESAEAMNTRYHVADASVKALQIIDQRLQRQQDKSGLAYGVNTGLRDLDYLLGDIEPTHLCVIAARPGMGKTTLAQMIAINAAKSNNSPVLFFSCEMSADQVTTRILSALGRIKFADIRRGTMTSDDYASWVHVTSQVLDKMPLVIDDRAGATIADIREGARRLKAEYGKVGVIIIDYLQLLRDPSQKNRFEEISEISRQLKKLAKDFNCPVIALSQLSRDCEKRPNKRPMPSDLRESGQIEQDADQIIMLYRDEVYDKASKDAGVAEIIIGKNRHGETGTARVATRLDYCHFTNIMHGED